MQRRDNENNISRKIQKFFRNIMVKRKANTEEKAILLIQSVSRQYLSRNIYKTLKLESIFHI